mmetsp:Transcript_25330/g.41156  ORF Transcript_25330/g.41156 Transcript_25330/m.41156 type:complete len:252 (+) Transcript_25330:58-813(+)
MESDSNTMRESWKRLLVYNFSAPPEQSDRPSLWGSSIFSGIRILLDHHTPANHSFLSVSTFFIPGGAVVLSGNAAQRVQVTLRAGISDDASVPFQTGTSSFALTRANRLLQLGTILLRTHLLHSINKVRVRRALRQPVALCGIGRFVLVGRVIFRRDVVVGTGDGRFGSGRCDDGRWFRDGHRRRRRRCALRLFHNNNCILLLRNNIHHGSTLFIPLANRLPRSLRIAHVSSHLLHDPLRLLLELHHFLGG